MEIPTPPPHHTAKLMTRNKIEGLTKVRPQRGKNIFAIRYIKRLTTFCLLNYFRFPNIYFTKALGHRSRDKYTKNSIIHKQIYSILNVSKCLNIC